MALLFLCFPATKWKQNVPKYDEVCIVLQSVSTVEMCANTAVQFLYDMWMLLHILFIYVSTF